MRVPAKLATAALCLLGRAAVMGRTLARLSISPEMASHVARHMPSVI